MWAAAMPSAEWQQMEGGSRWPRYSKWRREMRKITQEIIDRLKNADPESTASPYWMILDPRQNMDLNPHALANMITGPFFNRGSAEDYLKAHRYNFGKRAVVYCCSGVYSWQYDKFYRKATGQDE